MHVSTVLSCAKYRHDVLQGVCRVNVSLHFASRVGKALSVLCLLILCHVDGRNPWISCGGVRTECGAESVYQSEAGIQYCKGNRAKFD